MTNIDLGDVKDKVCVEGEFNQGCKELELERIRLEAQIKELRQILSILNNRLLSLEKALFKLELEVVELAFNPPINIEDAKVKWLQNKILEPHRKHGLKWKYRFVPGTSMAEKLVLWIPKDFEKRHVDEIKRCVNWVNKRQMEASKK